MNAWIRSTLAASACTFASCTGGDVDASSTPAATADAPPATASPAKPVAAGLDALKGKWVRTDGGYVIEIRSVQADGKLDAGYFNPRPIHVARAEATRDDKATRVFVELRDEGYPGSAYTLTHDAERDQLAGTYFQALEEQVFDVVFDRLK